MAMFVTACSVDKKNSKPLGPYCVQNFKGYPQVQSESLGIMGAIKLKGAYISSVFNRDGPCWQQSDNHKLHTLRNKSLIASTALKWISFLMSIT